MAAERYAHDLADWRDVMDGMNASDPDYAGSLDAAEQVAADLAGRAAIMNKDGRSGRARCENFIAATVLSEVM